MPDALALALQDFRDGADGNTLLVLCHRMDRSAELTVTGGGHLVLPLLAHECIYQKFGNIK